MTRDGLQIYCLRMVIAIGPEQQTRRDFESFSIRIQKKREKKAPPDGAVDVEADVAGNG